MLPVLLLALGASTAAACSTVLKARSAQDTRHPAWAARLPHALASIVASPLFAAALCFDALGVALQMSALHLGSLSVVQPVLCAALVISLGLDHLVTRTPVTRVEAAHAALLVAGLVVFLWSSGAMAPHGEEAIGRRGPAVVMSVLGVLVVAVAALGTRHADGRTRARSLAVAVATIYAATAALMTSVTHVAALRGVPDVLLSWQPWALVGVAGLGLLLGQQAFASAPLAVSLPVIASLDPLISVLVGVVVYGEVLRTTPLALVGEVLGLGALVLAVWRLSASKA